MRESKFQNKSTLSMPPHRCPSGLDMAEAIPLLLLLFLYADKIGRREGRDTRYGRRLDGRGRARWGGARIEGVWKGSHVMALPAHTG